MRSSLRAGRPSTWMCGSGRVLCLWGARALAADERNSWTATLEAEEHERLRSLRASMAVFEAGPLTRFRVNELLVLALQGQVTLLRMSRVFQDRTAAKRIDLCRAVGHGPTLALAGELRRCWKALGVSDTTLKVLLRLAVVTIGTQTRETRVALFLDLRPRVMRGVDAKAGEALAAEGSGQCSRFGKSDSKIDRLHSTPFFVSEGSGQHMDRSLHLTIFRSYPQHFVPGAAGLATS